MENLLFLKLDNILYRIQVNKFVHAIIDKVM